MSPKELSLHPEQVWVIMGKYRMSSSKKSLTGEGMSSICRTGVDISSGQDVAIKVYKRGVTNTKVKFERQIQVLSELRKPFDKPRDLKLWSEQLAQTQPSRLFMQLLDFSRDSSGNPGLDRADSCFYVIAELGRFSLRDLLNKRNQRGQQFTAPKLRRISRSIILAMAGLHAKRLVHLDFKPHNVMFFKDDLKIIDLDGCVKADSSVSILDSSISFSPCYCAPEWAKFILKDETATITIFPRLDVWSVGMTICELVTLEAVLKPVYANFLQYGRSHTEVSFIFSEWLSNVRQDSVIPKRLHSWHPDFSDLIMKWLVVVKPEQRRSCAEALNHPFLLAAKPELTSMASDATLGAGVDADEGGSPRRGEERHEKTATNEVILHKGMLWKLDTDGDPKLAFNWVKCDMWVTQAGALCYFNTKANKSLVLIDSKDLLASGLKDVDVDGSFHRHSFRIDVKSDGDSEQDEASFMFACDTAEDLRTWQSKLHWARDTTMTMCTGKQLVKNVQTFKLSVTNRRVQLQSSGDENTPIFKATLWKLKAEGDCMRDDHWFQREMWLSKTGSLVYWSKKEERELVHYLDSDTKNATVAEIPDDKSIQPHAFQVTLACKDGLEFAPGFFAAESQEMRARWMEELRKVAGLA